MMSHSSDARVGFSESNHNNISDYNNRLQSMLVNGGKNKYMNEMDSRFFMNVSIPEYVLASDSNEFFVYYKIVISTSFSIMEVRRRYRNFLVLHQELCNRLTGLIIPEFPHSKSENIHDHIFLEERRQNLELYLQRLGSMTEIWNCNRFVEFLDDDVHLLGVQVQTIRLSEKVQYLYQFNEELIGQLIKTNEIAQNALKTVNKLQERIELLEKSAPIRNIEADPSSATANNPIVEKTTLQSEVPVREISFPAKKLLESNIVGRKNCRSKSWTSVGSINSNYNVSTSMGDNEDDSSENIRRRGSLASSIRSDDASSFLRRGSLSSIGEDFILPDSDSYMGYESSAAIGNTNSNLSNICDWLIPSSPDSTNYASPSGNSAMGLQSPLSPQRNSKIPLDFVGITKDMIPVNTTETLLDNIIEDAISLLEPQENQLQYRSLIEKFVFQMVRKCLGAQVYEMGLHSLRCFLPDDDITLSIYLCRGLESTWYSRLLEKLNKLTSELAVNHAENGIMIKNVRPLIENNEQHVQCTVGNTTIDIKANAKLDLCFIAFLEELDRKIGKNHLFKRSLLLVRAWWSYEAPVYLKTRIQSSIFPHSAICIMALCLFFMEFASFDWSGYALTIFGPLRLSSLPLDIQSYVKLANGGVIPVELVTRYRDLALATTPLQSTNDTPESVVPTPLEQIPIIKKRSSISSLFEVIQDAKEEPAAISSSSVNSSRYMTILHPLDISLNVVPAVMTASHLDLFAEMIVVGATKVSETINISMSVNAESSEDSMGPLELNVVGTLLRETFARYGEGWKPDVHIGTDYSNDNSFSMFSLKNSLTNLDEHDKMVDRADDNGFRNELHNGDISASSSADCMIVQLEQILEQIRYSNFLQETQVTESALRILSMDILAERGPLPVGEVGKMLQEFTGISTLSTYLKDKFGGLKKFLENLVSDFVISTDHPFNPHVFLVDQLSRDDINSLAQGFMPNSFLNKTNKKRTVRNKKRNPSEPAMQYAAPPIASIHRTGTPPANSSMYSSAPSLMQPSLQSYSINKQMHPVMMNVPDSSISHSPSTIQSSDTYQYRTNRNVPPNSLAPSRTYAKPGNVPYNSANPSWNEYPNNRSNSNSPFGIGHSSFGNVGMPDPHAPAFVPGLFHGRNNLN